MRSGIRTFLQLVCLIVAILVVGELLIYVSEEILRPTVAKLGLGHD